MVAVPRSRFASKFSWLRRFFSAKATTTTLFNTAPPHLTAPSESMPTKTTESPADLFRRTNLAEYLGYVLFHPRVRLSPTQLFFFLVKLTCYLQLPELARPWLLSLLSTTAPRAPCYP